MFKRFYRTPAGNSYSLYADMLAQPHLLVAGATGSGKSVVINGMMHTALYDSPSLVQFILIDPKRVELVAYKRLPHTLKYASEPADMIAALDYAMTETERRYKYMQRRGLKKYDGPNLYIIIDEFADLMTTQKKEVVPLVQRLAQIGRAARVHLVIATQCPIADVIPTKIKCNFDARVGLRTRSQQDSRNILGVKGCETLPRYGQGYYMTAEGMTLYNIPMVDDAEIDRITSYWMKNRRPRLMWA